MYDGDGKLSQERYEKIPEKLAEIEYKIKNWESDIALDGKNIQAAIVEQPSLLAYYDQICVEAGYYVDLMEMMVKKVRAERIKYIRDNYSKEYTDTAIQKVVDGDPKYINAYQIYIEVKEVYDKCKSLVEAFKQRSYSLNNLVKIYEGELYNITIRSSE